MEAKINMATATAIVTNIRDIMIFSTINISIMSPIIGNIGEIMHSITPRAINCFECTFVTGNTEASKVSDTVKLAMRYYISTAIDNPDGVQTPEFLKTFHQVLSAERRISV